MFFFSENTSLHTVMTATGVSGWFGSGWCVCVCCLPQHLYEHCGVLIHLLLCVTRQTASRLESESETKVKSLYRLEMGPIDVCVCITACAMQLIRPT